MYSFVLGFQGKHAAPLKWSEYDGVFVYRYSYSAWACISKVERPYLNSLYQGCNDRVLQIIFNGKVLIYDYL